MELSFWFLVSSFSLTYPLRHRRDPPFSRASKLETRNKAQPKLETRNLKPETKAQSKLDLKTETRNQSPV